MKYLPASLTRQSLQFVSRKDVLRVLKDDIAKVTEEQIRERMSQSDPLATYQPKRETVLRQIIQEVVKYDTLSHRRDEIAGEPTYRDISTRKWYSSTHKFKSSKAVRFCKMSRSLGRKLAWVDTCCVDQSNAAELSEANQAMYKWYANSYLCIVYLADSTSYEDWVRELWFTESWTLQELLAPRRVRFYDKDWKPFNFLKSTTIEKMSLSLTISRTSLQKTIHLDDNVIYYLAKSFHVDLPTTCGQQNFLRLVETIATKNPSWDIFAWFGQPSTSHFALPLSPASYPRFEAHMVEGRGGAQEFKITPKQLSLRSLPPIPLELCSVANPDRPGKPFCVTLKPRSGEESPLGRYGNLVVECGATRLKLIRDARQLSACIINHHATRSRQQGKLVVGADYICFLLYSDDGGDDETPWMKLSTDNFLRISCVGMPRTTPGSDMVTREPDLKDTQSASVGASEPKIFALQLVTTSIRSPTS
ncbi:hypothetical protein J3R82DRAFT_7327 [Butyriboletus roseoflavus]|nr:hypothetical protein J3R82DRAFT_7327 [Butyriboletus roseoflavus]